MPYFTTAYILSHDYGSALSDYAVEPLLNLTMFRRSLFGLSAETRQCQQSHDE